MRSLTIIALLALASPAHALDLIAPRPDGLVLGTTVRLEVANDAAPACRVNGVAVAAAWTKMSKRWVGDVKLPGPGKHVIEVASGSKKESASVTVIGRAREAGDLVARRALAVKPITDRAWQWGPAVLTYGLARYARTSNDRATIVAALERYYAHHATRLPRIDYPDRCAPALGALALLRGENVSAGLPGARAVADYLRKEPRNKLGAIDHLGAKGHLRPWAALFPLTHHWSHSIWVDSLVMYGVFATQWGVHAGDPALRDFGAAQPGIFATKLQDASGLLAHAWDVKHAKPMGAKWLRGNGWVGAATVDVLDELPLSHPRRPELEVTLLNLSRGLAARQQANALWDTLVDSPGAGYSESSGSALAAYALAKGARLGVLPSSSRTTARRTFEALTARLARKPDGMAVTGTSVATNPYPAWLHTLVPRKDDVDYGIGSYLLLAAELEGETWQ